MLISPGQTGDGNIFVTAIKKGNVARETGKDKVGTEALFFSPVEEDCLYVSMLKPKMVSRNSWKGGVRF